MIRKVREFLQRDSDSTYKIELDYIKITIVELIHIMKLNLKNAIVSNRKGLLISFSDNFSTRGKKSLEKINKNEMG